MTAARHSSDTLSIHCRSSTTNMMGRRLLPIRVRWRRASNVLALIAPGVNPARRSVPSVMPKRSRKYGAHSTGSISTCLQPEPHLLGDGLGSIQLGDAEVLPKDVQQRQIRHRAPERLAVSLPVGDPLVSEAFAEFIEEAGLSDAGLTHDAHHLPVPARGRGQPVAK